MSFEETWTSAIDVFENPICLALLFSFVVFVLLLRYWRRAKKLDSVRLENKYKSTSLALQGVAVVAAAIFSASTLSLALTDYKLQNNPQLVGTLLVWDFSQSYEGRLNEAESAIQLTATIYNNGKVPTPVSKICLKSNSNDTTVLFPANSGWEEIELRDIDAFAEDDVLAPGELKKYRIRISKKDFVDRYEKTDFIGAFAEDFRGKAYDLDLQVSRSASDVHVSTFTLDGSANA